MERVDMQHALHALTPLEEDACRNAVAQSVHTRLKILPNHHMNTEGELQGYMFTCNREDMANVMPISKKTCNMSSVYECLCDDTVKAPLNSNVIRIVQDMPHYQKILNDYVDGMRCSPTPFASFACIPDVQGGCTRTETGSITFVKEDSVDQVAWSPDVPSKLGLYHAFTRTNTNDTREHKIYVVVSGCLTHAAEELHNLWLDCCDHITCGQFIESQELQWLRKATHRNHNRVAADLSELFKLKLRLVMDTDSPVPETLMAFPTTFTYMNDIVPSSLPHEIMLSESACFTDRSDNGVVMDMFSTEGLWLFKGPADHGDYNSHGTIFSCRGDNGCFPTKNIVYHDKYMGTPSTTVRVNRTNSASNVLFGKECRESAFLFPDEKYMRAVEQLGFSRNDGILSLMPLMIYVEED